MIRPLFMATISSLRNKQVGSTYPLVTFIGIFQDCQRCWLQVIRAGISSGGKHALYWWQRDRGITLDHGPC